MLSGWTSRSFADLVTFRNGMNFTQASRGQRIKVIGVGDFKDKEVLSDFSATETVVLNGGINEDDLLQNDDLLFVRSNGSKALIGRCVLIKNVVDPVSFSGFTIRARISAADIDPSYLSKLVRSPLFKQHLHRFGGGSSISNLSQQAMSEFTFSLPSLSEQQKIAAIVQTWDDAIEKVDSLISSLLKQCSAVRQGFFEAEYASGGTLLKARDVFMPASERARPDLPLLAVMQDVGIVRRDELERRVAMPDGDISTYKVVRPGDFVISLRSFQGGLEYSDVLGLVSPAYTVLRSTRRIFADYYRHYFKSRSFVGRLDKMIFGIRDGKQIAFRDFGDMVIPYPQIELQERHAKALDIAWQLVELNMRKKRVLELQKRGLMQKLLTGEWRVQC